MTGGTIGSRLIGRIEGDRDMYVPAGPDGDFMGECRAHGIRRHVSAKQIEAFAEAEYEARTWNGWGRQVCPSCLTAMSDSGACLCPSMEAGTLSAQDRLLIALGLPPVGTQREADPKEARRGVSAMHGPLTMLDDEIRRAREFAGSRGVTVGAAAHALRLSDRAQWLIAKDEHNAEQVRKAREAYLADRKLRYSDGHAAMVAAERLLELGEDDPRWTAKRDVYEIHPRLLLRFDH